MTGLPGKRDTRDLLNLQQVLPAVKQRPAVIRTCRHPAP